MNSNEVRLRYLNPILDMRGVVLKLGLETNCGQCSRCAFLGFTGEMAQARHQNATFFADPASWQSSVSWLPQDPSHILRQTCRSAEAEEATASELLWLQANYSLSSRLAAGAQFAFGCLEVLSCSALDASTGTSEMPLLETASSRIFETILIRFGVCIMCSTAPLPINM